MTHRQKIGRLIEESRHQGIDSRTTAPPLFRLLWALGLEIPPPFFLGFLPIALLTGSVFAVLFGGIGGFVMWLVFWQGLPFDVVVLRMLFMGASGGTLYGLFYGLYAARFYHREAARLGLPSSWKNYAIS